MAVHDRLTEGYLLSQIDRDTYRFLDAQIGPPSCMYGFVRNGDDCDSDGFTG